MRRSTRVSHLVKTGLKIHFIIGIDKHYRRSNGVFQIHPQPQVVYHRLQRLNKEPCKHTDEEVVNQFANRLIKITKATAEVIKLPPDPPITKSPPDFDSSITGVIEEGGCSPATTITLHIRLTGD